MAMGHRADAFSQPQVQRLIENSLVWLMGAQDSDYEGC
jgi:hypothetical protein